MADKHRTVNTHFWDDAYIETLTPNEMLLFLFLITNPQTNIAGIYEITLQRMHERTKISKSKIQTILEKFETDDKFIFRNNILFAVNAIGHQKTGVPTIAAGIETIVSTAPEWVKNRVCIDYQFLSHLILSNSIQSNSNGDGLSKTKPPYQPVPSETDTWLAVIAPATGAKSPRSMTKIERWTAVVTKAVLDDIPLPVFLKAVETQYARPPDELRFVTPENCLECAQQKQRASTKKTRTQRDELRDEGLIS